MYRHCVRIELRDFQFHLIWIRALKVADMHHRAGMNLIDVRECRRSLTSEFTVPPMSASSSGNTCEQSARNV
jgi:hypothetical protein